jgi:hypothetical protein
MTGTFRDIKTHLPFVLLVAVLGVYLGLKTFPEEGWSGWKEGSAQTMLTLEHWDRDGILEHRALFIPIGYSRAARHIDDPELRQHARGIVTGKLIGNRLYYTHYPSGYLLPFAALKKAGADDRSAFRLLSLSISLSALVFMYAFLNRLSTPSIAFFGALYYGASTMFLDFADSLASQPIDDLLRFSILFLSISGLRARESLKKRYTAAIWALSFMLAASSYDSVLFVFVWLVGLDYVQWLKDKGKQKKPVPAGKWALYALAPVCAFALQQAQNLWYLGWNDMLLDLKGVFLYRAAPDGGVGLPGRFGQVFTTLELAAGVPGWYSVPAIALIIAAFVYLRKHIFYRWPELSFFVLLLVAGSAYPVVFSQTSDLDYQGRQLSAALALLAGLGAVLLWRTAISFRALFNRKGGGGRAALFGLLCLSLGVLFPGQAKRTVEYAREWPNHAVGPASLAAYKALDSMTARDAVIVSVDSANDKRYPQAAPTFEYYAGDMVLSFKDPEDMVRDLRRLKGLSAEPFDVIVFTPQFETIESMLPYSRGREVRLLGGGTYALLIEADSPGL